MLGGAVRAQATRCDVRRHPATHDPVSHALTVDFGLVAIQPNGGLDSARLGSMVRTPAPPGRIEGHLCATLLPGLVPRSARQPERGARIRRFSRCSNETGAPALPCPTFEHALRAACSVVPLACARAAHGHSSFRAGSCGNAHSDTRLLRPHALQVCDAVWRPYLTSPSWGARR